MSLTGIVRKVFQPRQKELERHINEGPVLQREVLENLISEAKDTEYGRKYMFSHINGYEDFARHVPVNTYEELKGYIDRMRHGQHDVLWPTGQVVRQVERHDQR